ncbi:hypothetical protein A9X01_15580 [Mycobacterium asiaticum]|uniref:Uncharacterized protein n=1 Tax=Mycobacterium asiaticum TaxID=1790 RepID=A0A1A3CPK1_MYCAS|nr:hypothetical protein A9X01_15580 [Mycobacterium asiaticum]
MEHRVALEKVIKVISWHSTLEPYIDLACKLTGIAFPDGLANEIEMAGRREITGELGDVTPSNVAWQVADVAAGSLEQLLADEPTESVNGSLDELQGVEIGGRQVETEINAIMRLQAEHEISRADLENDIQKYRNNITEQYKDSPEVMQQQLARFNETAMDLQREQAEEHAAELRELQHEQELEQQKIHEQQLKGEQREQSEDIRQQETRQEEIRQAEQEEIRQEEARQEQAREDIAKLEQALSEEQDREEQARLEQALREEQAREEARLEQAREEARREQERLERERQEEMRRQQAARDALER